MAPQIENPGLAILGSLESCLDNPENTQSLSQTQVWSAGKEPRPYQRAVIERINTELLNGSCSAALLVAPTGSGKTVIASDIIRSNPNRHILFFVHRREIVFQAQKHLADLGIEAGVILAGVSQRKMLGIQIASVQTLFSRCIRGDQDLPPADIVLVDEAHHVRAKTYQAILKRYPDAKVIGLTATPCRRDGRGLGSTFKRMIETPQIEELIKLGFLVPTRIFAPSRPNLKGVKVCKGDYVERELERRVNTDKLVGDIVTHWLKHADRRKTLLYAVSVAHSVHLRDEFAKAGVRVEHIDGSTPKDERDAILERLASGETELVTNCMVLTEGYDLPDLSCIVLARPTRSMGLFRQMIGRGLRPAPGKDHCLVLDHAGAVWAHGFVEDAVHWTHQSRSCRPWKIDRATHSGMFPVQCDP
jgi:DNA repair protein RadD